MTAEELFRSITPPKRDSLFGVYKSFLLDDLLKHLQPVDLPIALKWVEEQGTRNRLPDSFEKLMDDIMVKAWRNIESLGVLENFARAVICRLRHHDQILRNRSDQSFKSMLENDDYKRRLILEAMIPLLNDAQEAVLLIYTPIVLNKDVSWMIEHMQVSDWNPDLDVAMENQLVNRYLKDNRCQHGLYLAGWFNCDQWDDNDYRKKQAKKLSKDQAQGKFGGQAVSLSRQGIRVKTLVMDAELR
jgi:hypothetical protein